ncbi:MAG: hypothetical protein WEC75_04285 [Dehalococcoidia bacterium]
MDYEVASLSINLGDWTDEAEGRPLLPAIQVDFSGQELPPPKEVQAAVREAGLQPWQTTETTRQSYPNASSTVFSVAIDAYPMVTLAIWSGAIAAVAEQIVSRILKLFARQPSWDVGSAYEIAQRMPLYQVRLSEADLSQKSAVQRDDGTWVFVFHDARTQQDHLVVVAKNGVTGHASLGALLAGSERTRNTELGVR